MTKKTKSPTIAEAVKKFYAYKFGSLRPNSRLVTQASIEAIEKCCSVDFNTTPVKQLDKHVLREAFGAYAAGKDRNPMKERAKSTVHRRYQDWGEFLRFLVNDGYLDGVKNKTPMDSVLIAKLDKNQPKPLPGWDEDAIPRLITALKDGVRKGRDPWWERDVAIVSTMLSTGARASEVCDMNLDAIEGRHPEYFIRVVGKGGKARSIPVEEGLNEILGAYLETRKFRFPKWKQKPEDPLWLGVNNENGTKRMTRWQLDWLLESCLRAASLKRPPGAMAHMFRHTYGTVLATPRNGEPGIAIHSLAKLMGHESITTTQGYIDSSAQQERAGAARNTVYEAMRSAFKTED